MSRSKGAQPERAGAPAARKRGRRSYSDAFKADAVARAMDAQSVAQVARDLGVARNTLSSWVRDADESSSAPEGLVEAVRSGDRKSYLEAVRDQLAVTIAGGLAPRDLPPNVRLLNETMRELEEMQTREAEEAADAANAPDEEWDEDEI